jgi:hypothetical protein
VHRMEGWIDGWMDGVAQKASGSTELRTLQKRGMQILHEITPGSNRSSWIFYLEGPDHDVQSVQ